MLVLPIRTNRLKNGDDLASLLEPHVQDGDIVVVSSKAMATVEGASINLAELTPSKEATKYAKECRQDPSFTEAVLKETKRLHGDVVGTCPWALLTALKPKGMGTGRILCPNAGLDTSNIEDGYAIGWPKDPVKSAAELRSSLKQGGKRVAVLLSDSCCRPGRLGVVAFALAVAGIDPLLSQVGRSDLFGSTLKFTHEAVADQLATAANAVMGNADQSTPAAIIRDHGYQFSDFTGWVEGIAESEDLFQEIIRS
ncbi:MAG: coenzyme F420-0:L-glutamate ligase [Candidatus Peribacteraceae bacterium]